MVLVRRQQKQKNHAKPTENDASQSNILPFALGAQISIMLVGSETIYRHALEVILRENIESAETGSLSIQGCLKVEEFDSALDDLAEPAVKALVVLLLDEGREAALTLRNIDELRKINSALKIIIISNNENVEYTNRCLEKGVHAYILSDIEAGPLMDCVVAVAHDYMVFPAYIYHRKPEAVLPQSGSCSNMETSFSMLSPNETEARILGCLAAGMPNKEISRELDLSDAATKLAVRTIIKKVGVKNRVQLAVWAQKNGYS